MILRDQRFHFDLLPFLTGPVLQVVQVADDAQQGRANGCKLTTSVVTIFPQSSSLIVTVSTRLLSSSDLNTTAALNHLLFHLVTQTVPQEIFSKVPSPPAAGREL